MEFALSLSSQLGPHLKSLRKMRGLSQAELGRLIGVGQTRIADIEANPGLVSVEQLLRISRALGAELVLRASTTAELDANLGATSRLSATMTIAPSPLEATRDHEQGYLARMLGHDLDRLRNALDETGKEMGIPAALSARTRPRDIPSRAIPALAAKLEFQPDTLHRLLQATLGRLDALHGTPLERQQPKGSW